MKANSMNHILFDCDRMKYVNTGLFHYCIQLGHAIQENLNAGQEQISYYVRKQRAQYIKGSSFLYQTSFHKHIFPDTSHYNIWHCTYQSSLYHAGSKKLRKVLTIHDLNFLHEPGWDERMQKKELKKVQKKLDQYDYFVFISEFVKDDVLKYLNIRNKPYRVIYNGCNYKSRNTLYDPLFKPESDFLFTIGEINAKKNFQVLTGLLTGNDLHLIIAGIPNESYTHKVMQAASDLGVSDRIKITGTISENDKEWYMQHCSPFVFPSLAEGFGLPVIEAMSFGKPVFLSKSTSLPEIGGPHAYYFDSFDQKDMQRCFYEGMADYTKRQPQKQIKEWAARFNWDDAAKQYLEVYRSLY